MLTLLRSDIALVSVAYALAKLAGRTRVRALHEIPLADALERVRDNPGVRGPPVSRWRALLGVLWD